MCLHHNAKHESEPNMTNANEAAQFKANALALQKDYCMSRRATARVGSEGLVHECEHCWDIPAKARAIHSPTLERTVVFNVAAG